MNSHASSSTTLTSWQGLCRAPGVVTHFEATEVDPDPEGTLTLEQRLDVCDESGHEVR